MIRIRKNDKGGVIGFEFVFKIALHQDDRNVLEFIKKTLNCGRLNTERNTLVFTISQLSDIETILIPLFEGFPLNTVKFLDYLSFKEAFFMYKNRKSSTLGLQNVYSEIIKLKDSMNDKRINFVLPEFHSIRITGNYLVGLLEGDGSFYLNKHDMSVRVSLVTISNNRLVLEKIREFLLSLLDGPSYMLGSTTKLINIYDKKPQINQKPVSIFPTLRRGPFRVLKGPHRGRDLSN